ncbi:Phosphoglucosamine mutase [Alteracholeplasma palmae J233]|uniref:Phosphoglucosamine mutase n=1 Tax=Alteracholeplasma palmae (strain ATCC 49389 / J233) TaxID=1318466 RepID=U4KRE8_ALTPJ|nr:hypothetical protein [Alteracholeplasma palmae]CCV64101.1 Phosphoglucosamine mutase [Alteracholeplasma palmae J233]
MNKKYFGTDGIRGVAFSKLNSELAFRVGIAIAKVFKPETIVIGQDTRKSSNMLAYSVALGASTLGVSVKLAEVVSTPMLAYYSKEKNMIGVMITASHNPYQDNGIKIFKYGYKMLDEEELAVEKIIDEAISISDANLGLVTLTNEVTEIYEAYYETLHLPQTNLKIAIDTANGATYKIAPRMFSNYSNNYYQIGNIPDGENINLNVGSTHLDAIIEKVKETKSDLGFSYDGDGDRILVVDQNKVYDGDMIIYIIAKYLKEKNLLKKDTVVLTKMSNPGIIKSFNKLGIKVSLTDVGDKYVSNEIMTNGYSIGGENSGHIILNDLLPSGDGVLVSLFITKILTESKMTLASYTKDLEIYPQKLINIKNVDTNILSHKDIINALEEAKKELGEDSLLLVRKSGTEPLVRVTVSHKDELVLNKVITKLVDLITKLGALK